MSKYLLGIALTVYSQFVLAWPEWVVTNPQQEQYITGVGIGNTPAEADNAALAEISSQLITQVQTSQTQLLEKKGNLSQTHFYQNSKQQTLPFKLVGLESLYSAQKNTQFAVQLGVKKSSIIHALNHELSQLAHLSLPDAHIEQQLVWVLDKQKQLKRASELVAVVEVLSQQDSTYRSNIESLDHDFNQVLKQVNCQVLVHSNTAHLASAIEKKFSCSGEHQVWIKPHLKWLKASSAGKKYVKSQLTIEVTQAREPFGTLKTYQFNSIAHASTYEKAKALANDQLLSKLKQDVSLWENAQ